jgi:hypothetical protein
LLNKNVPCYTSGAAKDVEKPPTLQYTNCPEEEDMLGKEARAGYTRCTI